MGGGSAWSGVGCGVDRTEPTRFGDETLRVAVQEWQRDRGGAMVKYGPIADWDTSQVTDMSNLFMNATTFNEPLTRWDTSNVGNMSDMFYNASAFNQPLAQFDTRNVRNMIGMFLNASAFNQPLNDRWDTSNVVSMDSMFHNATAFNQPLDHLDTGRVDQMSYMFSGASAFNQPLNNRWDTRNVVTMKSMFANATAFDQPLAQWDTSRVENMSYMFYNATAFNQPLSRWNTQNVRFMNAMFQGATSFNQSLREWDLARRVDRARMFDGATAFNPDWAPIPRLPVRRTLQYDVEDDHAGRLQWDAQRHAWQVKWTAMQQQKPDTVAKVRKAHRALYDEWPGEEEKTMCQSCFERPRSVVFVECRHVTQCDDCYARWASAKGWVNVSCPICRKVSRVQHIDEYLSDHTLFLSGGRTPAPPVAGCAHRESRPTMRTSPTSRRRHHSNRHAGG